MCGRFKLLSSAELQWLCEVLGISLEATQFSEDKAPGASIAIVHTVNGRRQVSDAIWWLLLDAATLKPNYKYASFNSRADKLSNPKSISYKPYRESRCLIPASAFVEGLGDKKTYHKVEFVDSAIVFGGIYREYLNRETGEIVYAASIITLPGDAKGIPSAWREIHPKSLPLLLDFEDQDLVEKWLDPKFQDVDQFQSLLEPRINRPLRVTKIDKPSKWNSIEDSFVIC